MSTHTDVQVSLVNTDNCELLRRCLGSLEAACAGLAARVTVVDNASRDESVSMLKREFPSVELIENSRRLGFSANHNQVIGPALADPGTRYVLILNEDTELDAGAVHQLVAFGDREAGVGAVGPVIRGTDGAIQPSLFALPTVRGELYAALRPGAPPKLARNGAWLNGSCLLVRADALRQIGPLDERFFIFSEDTDLGRRLHDAGWSSTICATATIVHHGHSTVSRPEVGSAMERQMHRSRYLYWAKHKGRLTATFTSSFVRATLLLRALKAWLMAAMTGDKSERRLGTLLLELARWNPRERLPHELAAADAGDAKPR
jgi:N-acetylglucosaminyl-diphospho-decaprenol L-rhamnosyltransferase